MEISFSVGKFSALIVFNVKDVIVCRICYDLFSVTRKDVIEKKIIETFLKTLFIVYEINLLNFERLKKKV